MIALFDTNTALLLSDQCEHSIRRDIESLRCFLSEQGLMQEISYDRGLGGYRMENPEWCALKNSEVLAVCKILLESRSLRRDEMFPMRIVSRKGNFAAAETAQVPLNGG